tara:strand:+ start:216 stop:443 length:228 start_codon:yes stop_codon:yes gene_type:complete
MISNFLKKLIKYYLGKFKDWIRIQKFNLELDSDIKKYHKELDKKIKKYEIKELGKFGENNWSISIGDTEGGNTTN